MTVRLDLRTTGDGAVPEPGSTTGAPSARGHVWLPLVLPLLAAGSAGGALLVQRPVLTSEPLFALTNAAVTAAMVTVGSYMIVQKRERFTGLAFAAAGLLWPMIALDIYPGWGPYVAFVFGGGALFFPPICWGVLRYGRPRLVRLSERVYVPLCVLLTSGTGVLFGFVTRPEWVGLPTGSSWPTLWPDETAFTVGAVLLCSGFNLLAVWFVVLARNLLREAPPNRRDTIRPLCVFGAAFGLGSSLVFTVSTFDSRLLSFHALVVVIGVLALSLTGGLGAALARQDLLGSHFLAHLPDSRTPESVARYLRKVLQDDSAELFFVDPDTDHLIDADGRRRYADRELAPARFHEWIPGSDGSRVGLLTGDQLLRDDPGTLVPLRRVLSILAENARLQAVLRRRVIQLTVARTAQQLAFDQAREGFRRDLHDGVQQTIAAARMDLEGLTDVETPDERRHAAAQLEAKLRLALDQVRSLKQGVDPPELQFGLRAAIDRSVAELRLTARCRVTDTDLGVLALPVYYLVRESLTNARKHARADLVSVDVSTDGRTIDVVVHDDGTGGAGEHGRGGIGGMRRRVEELGGRWELHSPVGEGTTMRVSVPCGSS